MFTSDLLLNGHTVQAVGSRRADAAAQFAVQHGIPTAHASYDELVADPEVDAIYVASPHPFHAEHASLALNAGKHVLVEKPFTLNADEARELVALAEEKGLVLLEAMWTRFLPHMQRIREILEAGTIGEVRSLIADHTQKLSEDPEHRMNSLELGGGALLDLGIYPISFASSLFGAPQAIQAAARFKATGADAQVATIFQYAGGQMASTLSASDTKGPNRATILGSEGRIEIDGVWYSPTSFRVLDSNDAVISTSCLKSTAAACSTKPVRSKSWLREASASTPACRSTRPFRSCRRSTTSGPRSGSSTRGSSPRALVAG